MIKNLKDAKLDNKTVLLRVDVNEPHTEGHLDDDFRLQKIIPTIQFLRNQNCKVVLIGHLGRPTGPSKEDSLKPVGQRLAELLKYKFVESDGPSPDYPIPHLIFYTGDLNSQHAHQDIASFKSTNVVLLENLRFYPEEEANDDFFAKKLAGLAEVYINDGFAVSHRRAASVVGVTKYLPSYAGLVLAAEIQNLDTILKRSSHPFSLLMGGIKISDKAKTLENLAPLVDQILLGGGLANSLLANLGYSIGKSTMEPEALDTAKHLLRNYKQKFLLPKDLVVARDPLDKATIRVSNIDGVKPEESIFDIGPKTILEFATKLKDSSMLVWNGPLGYFEHKPFDTGTMALAKVVGGISTGRCFSVVGGGETVDALRISGQVDYIDHVSTGGGAMLEYLSGAKLPGIQALEESNA